MYNTNSDSLFGWGWIVIDIIYSMPKINGHIIYKYQWDT